MKKHAFEIYNASAGSGKTYTLVKEYLKIILKSNRDNAYKNILAITFTNKAVEEMKSRIVSTLEEFTKDEPNPKANSMLMDIASEISMNPKQIQEKAKRIIKNIIHNYASFDISTIDKFTHRVIRSFALELGLPLSFEVTLDTDTLLSEAIDSVIEYAGEDENLTKLLVDFATEKTDDDKSWDVTYDFLNIGKLLTNENNKSEITYYKDKSITEFLTIKTRILKSSNDLEQEIILKAVDTLNYISDNGIEFSSFYSSYVTNHFQKIASGNIEINTTHYKYLDENNENFKSRYGTKIPQDQKDRIDAIAQDVFEALRWINSKAGKLLFYKAFLKNLTPLSVLNTINQELLKIQQDQNILSISEFNNIIYNQVKEQPAPFIYEKLGDRYSHFFIDEFQDTSKMQWENLVPLIDNALSGQNEYGEAGSLMIVGDPKQSIYRWRGGKAEQFIDLSNEKKSDEYPFSNPDRKVTSLETNYRSYSEVINFNNQFFKQLSEEFNQDDYRKIYLNSPQKTNSNLGGYVNISFINEALLEDTDDELGKSDLYLDSILTNINNIVQDGFDFKDIVILVRRNHEGVLIANHLTENEIPIVSSETLLLANSDDVKLILNVLEFIKNKNNIQAKANFLYYLGKRLNTEVIHDFIKEGIELKNEIHFEKWLNRYHLQFSFEAIRKKSLYEVTEIIIENFLNKSNNIYIQSFLDLILEQNMRNQSSIDDFLDYWKKQGYKKSIPSPKGNAIQIMTIHKSKGLEFPVVIFPFADQDYTTAPKSKIWIQNDIPEFELTKVLVEKNTNVKNYSDSAASELEQRNQEELLDNINVLYVALTRAVEQLYIISRITKTSKGELRNTMASFFIKFLELNGGFDDQKLQYEFGNSKRLSISKPLEDNKNLIELVKQNFDAQNIKIATHEAMMWDSDKKDSIEHGNITHKILSYIKTNNDIDFAIKNALINGWITLDQETQFKNTITNIVTHPLLSEFFNSNYTALNERAIIRKEFAVSQPDKIVILPNNQAIILDYKTGAAHDKYRDQIENYALALEEMNYQVKQKTIVYIKENIEIISI